MTRTDSLTAAYAADYMEKVFYFCLKKTVNDLTETGALTLPEDPASSPAGVYLELE